MKIAVILLAGGNSRRFGENKLLFEIEGKPMYRHALDKLTLLKAGEVTVVTQYVEVAEGAREAGAKVLLNPHPEEGISSSLKIGLTANLEADACLFAVADQPWVTGETLEGLLKCFTESGKGMACISTDGTLGNPCVFSQKYYPELLSLTGDVGGKRVMLNHREDVALFPVRNAKELQDIDRKP